MSGSERQIGRVLRFLQPGGAQAVAAGRKDAWLLEAPGRGHVAIDTQLLRRMVTDGLVDRQQEMLRIRPEGEAWLQRHSACGDAFLHQHGGIAPALEGARINLAESPLATLARMKEKSGRPWLSEDEIRAGERLRSDFTRGQLSPRTGTNWAGAGGGTGAGGAVELTDAAMAARQSVHRALGAVGPELSGVLIDICCFLKGLAQVETERGWPVRSAKLMLRTALAALARHYEPRSRPQRHAHRWGAEGYRPAAFGGS